MFLFIHKYIWIFIGLLLLSSCISMSKAEQSENILAFPSLDSSIEKGLETPFFSSGSWPKEKWWEVFDSEALNALIGKALQSNPNLQAARRRIEVAKQSAAVVRSKLFPLVYFDAEDCWELLSYNGLYKALNPKIPVNATLIDLTLSFTYEFDFWGKNRSLFRAALGQQKAEEAEEAEVQLITSTAVAQAYFTLKTNLLRKTLLERLYVIRKETFELQTLLQTHALSSSLVPLLSLESVLEIEKHVFSIKEQVEADKHLINALIGNGPDALFDLGQNVTLLPETLKIPKDLPLQLLSRRPDLMAQIWRVEALAQEVGAAKTDFYPNINLSAFLGLESVLYSLLFKSHSKTVGMQPALTLPIFTAGAIRANLRGKKASFDAAVDQYNSLILEVVKEVADLIVLADSIFNQKKDQESIVGAAQDRFTLTLMRRQSGLDSLFAAYLFEEELIQKQLEDVTLLYSQYLAVIKFIKALGGGYCSDYAIPITQGEKSCES